MALNIRDHAIKQRASPDPVTAQAERIQFTYIRNQQSGQKQLSEIRRLGGTIIMSPILINLRAVMVLQELQIIAYRYFSAESGERHPPSTVSIENGWFATSSLLLNRTLAKLTSLIRRLVWMDALPEFEPQLVATLPEASAH